MAKREENESANLWLPGQTVHLERVNCTLAVCLCAVNSGTRKKVKKAQCDTVKHYAPKPHIGGDNHLMG